MASGIRIAVHLELEVYRALKVKAATTDRSVSDLVNAAVLESLCEDALDLEAFDRRAKETLTKVTMLDKNGEYGTAAKELLVRMKP